MGPINAVRTIRFPAIERKIPNAPMKAMQIDRKSTRLNSSHMSISYAVFCLKKKKNNYNTTCLPNSTTDNPHELNQENARYCFSSYHLQNICTAPLPPNPTLSRHMTPTTTSI